MHCEFSSNSCGMPLSGVAMISFMTSADVFNRVAALSAPTTAPRTTLPRRDRQFQVSSIFLVSYISPYDLFTPLDIHFVIRYPLEGPSSKLCHHSFCSAFPVESTKIRFSGVTRHIVPQCYLYWGKWRVCSVLLTYLVNSAQPGHSGGTRHRLSPYRGAPAGL